MDVIPEAATQGSLTPMASVRPVPIEQHAALPAAALMQLMTGYWVTQAIYVAAALRVADHLQAGPRSADELAVECGADPASLYRVLRALATAGVVNESEDRHFSLTPLSELLISDTPGSLHPLAIWHGEPWHWGPWGGLLESVRTGTTAFDRIYGTSQTSYFAANPAAGAVFDAAMSGFASVSNLLAAWAYDFSGVDVLVDVGGGRGDLLGALLQANTTMRGILLDMPGVVEQAGGTLARLGVLDRCEAVGGDFFAEVPGGGSHYLLSMVLNDWPDDEVVRILRRIREVIPSAGELIILQMVVPATDHPNFPALLDLEMLVHTGGRERTEAEFTALLATADFTLTQVVPSLSPVSLLVAAPRETAQPSANGRAGSNGSTVITGTPSANGSTTTIAAASATDDVVTGETDGTAATTQPIPELNHSQRAVLAALCDTIFPAIEAHGDDAPDSGFLARTSSDLDIPREAERLMADGLAPAEFDQARALLDGFAAYGFATQPLPARLMMIRAAMDMGPDVKRGVQQVKLMCLFLAYARQDENGHNPNWPAIGYPGPVSLPPSSESAPKTIRTIVPDSERLTVDVCVIGSGPGGAVVAARCAQEGRSVLVLEMGGYRNEQDFRQSEYQGLQQLYLGGGLVSAENGSISILAGSTLGGGSVSNYMTCIRPPERILREWEADIPGLCDDEFANRHVEPVLDRISANSVGTTLNGTHRHLRDGLAALGLPSAPTTRNAAPEDEPSLCGYCGFGCQQGSKRSMLKTYLQDASDAGALCITDCRAERIRTEDGRVRGVEAVIGTGESERRLFIEAADVVVACGGVESPALLLRSGIGGPAVGRHLRVQPAYAVGGVYDDRVNGWVGQPQSLVCDAFDQELDGHGFVIEGLGISPGLWAAGTPWLDGADHKQWMSKLAHTAPLVAFVRDHGSGEVVVDDRGRTVVRWSLSDHLDRELVVRANVQLARVHHAAGAAEIYTLHAKPTVFRRGDDFEAYLDRIRAASYDAGDIACFTAHQMGSCRMGTDPATSVANGRGELHDVPGVWIADASAFPSAPGVNPMVTILAMAHRTASCLLEENSE